MLLRRQALEEIGLLDDGFFMYWEDSDLCFRFQDAGWKLAVAPKLPGMAQAVWKHRKEKRSGRSVDESFDGAIS